MLEPKLSIEEIADRLAYYGQREKTRECIIHAISKLPTQAQIFSLDRCAYLSIANDSGMVLPGKIGVHASDRTSRNMWLILLSDELSADGEGVVAHEIAHAWLKHDRLGDIPESGERDAAMLAKSWGFEGRGTDPEFCDAPFR